MFLVCVPPHYGSDGVLEFWSFEVSSGVAGLQHAEYQCLLGVGIGIGVSDGLDFGVAWLFDGAKAFVGSTLLQALQATMNY